MCSCSDEGLLHPGLCMCLLSRTYTSVLERVCLAEDDKADRGLQQGLAKRAGKISVRTGRLRVFNCCIQIYNGKVKTTQSHSPTKGIREKTRRNRHKLQHGKILTISTTQGRQTEQLSKQIKHWTLLRKPVESPWLVIFTPWPGKACSCLI